MSPKFYFLSIIVLIVYLTQSQSAIVPFRSVKGVPVAVAVAPPPTSSTKTMQDGGAAQTTTSVKEFDEDIMEATEIQATTETTEFDVEEIDATTEENWFGNLKCLPSGFPCVPTHTRNDTEKISHLITPCCSGKCLYEPGWIDAECK